MEQNTIFTSIELKNIKLEGGKIEIGFFADGAAGAQCQVDDVMLVRNN